MKKDVKHLNARDGYDLWASTYDQDPNPVISLDKRHTIPFLNPRPGERILDAGCGTGRNFQAMIDANSNPVGIDFSKGMLGVAKRKYPRAAVAVADLDHPLPLKHGSLDAALCALVGEHLKNLPGLFRESFKSLRPGGRFVFSVYHPEMAAAGKEANFEQSGVEFRLGAYKHRLDDYLNFLDDAGFTDLSTKEFKGDERLANELPSGHRYLNFPVLLIIKGSRPNHN